MNLGRWTLSGMTCALMITLSGCANLEELRQAQMLNRNLQAEKARLEQDLHDNRAVRGTLRTRADSLENQLASKDLLVTNLQNENDRLDSAFRTAQATLDKLAGQPIGMVNIPATLPPELDTALHEFAAQYPDAVVYDAGHGIVKWTADVLFAFASDVVKQTAYPSLQHFGEIMQSTEAKDFEVLVAGHTDNVPIAQPETLKRHPTNWHLSSHRAIAVARLLQKNGLDPTRVGVMGFGQFRPMAANDSQESRARNRRVEMYIVPRGSFGQGSAALSFTGGAPEEKTK